MEKQSSYSRFTSNTILFRKTYNCFVGWAFLEILAAIQFLHKISDLSKRQVCSLFKGFADSGSISYNCVKT